MIHSLNGDTDFFDIVGQPLQRDRYLFIICQDYVLQNSMVLH